MGTTTLPVDLGFLAMISPFPGSAMCPHMGQRILPKAVEDLIDDGFALARLIEALREECL